MVGGRLSFAGGGVIVVCGRGIVGVGRGRCVWGCRRRPSALWDGVRGVVEKSSTWHTHPGVLGGGCCCRPSSFLGSWAFVVDVAHPDGCATSAVWWWVSWSASASLALLTMWVTWVWDSPGILYSGGGHDGGVGWWWLTTSSGRRGMVMVRHMAWFVPTFPDLAGTEKVICKH